MKHIEPRFFVFVLTIAVLLALAAAAAASPGFVFQKVALRGEPVPGTEPGTVFGQFSDIYTTAVPSLDETGRVSFTAPLEGPAVTPSNRSGIWTWQPGGGLQLLVRADDAAPDAGGGVFNSFPIDFALMPPAMGDGRVGFSASLTGTGVTENNNEGLWSMGSGPNGILVREGDAAAGFAPDVRYSSVPFGLELNQARHAFVRGSVVGPGIGSTNDEAFWTDRGGALAAIVREGDPAPNVGAAVVFGGAGEFIGTGYTFESTSWSNASRAAFQGNLTGNNVDTFNNEALFVERAGGMALLVREGMAAPGIPGRTFGGNSVTADFGDVINNRLDHAAFTARVAGGSGTEYVLYSNHTGALLPVARPGDPAPGTGQTFGIIVSPILSDGGRIAFRASLSNAGSWPPLGVWWDQPNAPGQLAALAVPGAPAPGRPGVTIASVNFLRAFTESGRLAFVVVLDDPAFGGQRTAVYLAEPSGDVREVVATGDLFDVQGTGGPGADLRTITLIQFGAMNPSGEIALRLDFDDGRSGHYHVSPAGPVAVEPQAGRGVVFAQNAPNPFARSTRFDFELPAPGRVALSVFDASGRLVRRVLDEPRPAGRQAVEWDGRDQAGALLGSGIYWARFQSAGASRAIRMVRLER